MHLLLIRRKSLKLIDFLVLMFYKASNERGKKTLTINPIKRIMLARNTLFPFLNFNFRYEDVS